MMIRGHCGYMSGDGSELGVPGRENGIWMVMLCSRHSGIKSVFCTRKFQIVERLRLQVHCPAMGCGTRTAMGDGARTGMVVSEHE